MQPFLKWAGGKRWLFDETFKASLPPFERYVEPFLGGGAGFFALTPQRALLSDLNPDLINLYKVVRDFPYELVEVLKLHQMMHCRDYYYDQRANKPTDSIQSAAWMLYLNRTCWNGLYRLNLAGQFNVPIGSKSTVISPLDDFPALSKCLRNAEVRHCDFQGTIDDCGEGDLVFVDPPYTVKHNTNGFVKYNESIFKWEDQCRLKVCLEGAKARGATIVLTNADHESVRDLYDGFGHLVSVSRKSVISGRVVGRSSVTELMVRS